MVGFRARICVTSRALGFAATHVSEKSGCVLEPVIHADDGRHPAPKAGLVKYLALNDEHIAPVRSGHARAAVAGYIEADVLRRSLRQNFQLRERVEGGRDTCQTSQNDKT